MFKRIDHVEIVPVQSPDHRWPTAAIISETRRSAWRTSTPKARPKPGRCLQRTTHSCDLRHLHKPYARQITGPRAGKGQTRCTGSLGARLRDRAKPDDNARYLAQWQAGSGLSWRRALIGILGSRASPGSCTIARPPACSIAMSPFVPSLPPPVSMIPMTREPYTLAADRKRGSAAGLV